MVNAIEEADRSNQAKIGLNLLQLSLEIMQIKYFALMFIGFLIHIRKLV